ncbi:MAG: urease accessory protein UreD [Limnohabitans sp.]|nr:urease accessory protein UreD [Limnohabitans sp.]
MEWQARLKLDYCVEDRRCVVRHEHHGPLHILKSLYPEGDRVCHNILVHPPSGLVGGDELLIDIKLQTGAHSLVTTPGATRFYGSDAKTALQQLHAHLDEDACLEWLPLEALAYNGCQAHNQAVFHLSAGSRLMAWDITALGLPHAGQPFVSGQFQQHLEIAGVWLERGLVAAADHRLMHSPLGLNGHSCQSTLVFAQGTPMDEVRREHVIAIAREVCEHHPLRLLAGVTSPDARVVLVRVLSPQVESAMDLLRSIWLQWRHQCWQLPAVAPRIWAM